MSVSLDRQVEETQFQVRITAGYVCRDDASYKTLADTLPIPGPRRMIIDHRERYSQM